MDVVSTARREVRIRYRLAKRELKRWREFDVTLSERVRAWRSGFLTRSTIIYPLDNWDRSCFMTDVQRERSNKINFQHGIATRNKLLFARQMKSIQRVSHPTVFAIIDGETVIAEDWDSSSEGRHLVNEVLDAHGSFVLKPVYGYRGTGIYVVKTDGEGQYKINGQVCTSDDVQALVADCTAYLLTKHVSQAPYSNTLFPEATNTLRLVTLNLPQRPPRLIAAIQRIGTSGTAPTDNWSNGGLAADIDQGDGRLAAAIGLRDGQRKVFDTHPDTGAQITGCHVPNWSDLEDSLIEVASEFPELPYLAWDVVPQSEGPPVVIEANAFPDVDITQLRTPLFSDTAVREFFDSHGVI